MSSDVLLRLLSSGSNARGQLGNGSTEDSNTFLACSFTGIPPHTLPTGTSRVVDIAGGANHTLLLLEVEDQGKEIWVCGDGRKSQLGAKYQHTITSTGLFRKLDLGLAEAGLGGYHPKLISATWETSYIVFAREGRRDVVVSMGSDDYGDLGVGHLDKDELQKDFHLVDFSRIPSLSEKLDVLGIYSGQRQTVLHVQSASGPILVGWGACRHGQLGPSIDLPLLSVPRILSINAEDLASVHLGLHHTAVLYNSGEIISLGSNRKRQLEVVKGQTQKAHSIGCTWNGTYVAIRDHDKWSIRSSGSNSHSQLGWKSDEESTAVGEAVLPDERGGEEPSVTLACGSEHVLVVVDAAAAGEPQLWGWGWNEHGNLGLGHTNDISTPTRLHPIPGRDARILGVWAGLGTSWIVAEETSEA